MGKAAPALTEEAVSAEFPVRVRAQLQARQHLPLIRNSAHANSYPVSQASSYK